MITISGTGRIASEFKTQISAGGKEYIRLRLLVKLSKKDSNGKYGNGFISILLLQPQHLDFANKYFEKGHTIEFGGTFEPNVYTNKKGVEVSDYTIKVNNIGRVYTQEPENQNKSLPVFPKLLVLFAFCPCP
ncbi:hypothetical protein FACS189496_4140 [Bacilli bacterium]|nr:hypothetical protein FACS189496_4140 [Bacilli bacterium]